MDERPRVSIITPTHNHEKFIARCIESVLSQTYTNWEQIVIDDGSTDKTYELVKQFKDDRIRPLRQENVGIWKLNETYNKALKISRGELVAVLEGDDFWPPWKLEKQVSTFNEQTVLCFGKAVVINSAGKILQITNKDLSWLRKRRREEKIRRLLLVNFIPACTVLCRKSALLSIGGFQQPIGTPYVDYPTWLELSLIGEIQVIDEILGYWQRHDRQVTALMETEMLKAHIRNSMSFIKKLPPELEQTICITDDDLVKNYHQAVMANMFYSGRRKLFIRDWINARADFKRALIKGGPPTKIKALIGLAFSYMHFNLESIAILTGAPELNDLR